jgi:GDP-D-mannose dehydratase
MYDMNCWFHYLMNHYNVFGMFQHRAVAYNGESLKNSNKRVTTEKESISLYFDLRPIHVE